MFRRATLTTGVVVVMAAALTGCASGRAAWTAPPGKVTSGLAIAEPATPGAEVASSEDDVVGEIEFHAFDLRFEPSSVTVDAPGRYRVTCGSDEVT